MKEELTERLVSSLDKVMAYVERGVGFAEEQAPLVVDEIILYGRVMETSYILIELLILAGGLWGVGKLLKLALESDDENYILCLIPLVPILLFVAVIFTLSLSKFYMAWFAPRLYVLEFIGRLF